MTASLVVEIDGQTFPLSKCSWVFRGTCGCAYGVMIAETPSRTNATEDKAWEDFEPNAIQRKRDRALGDNATLVPTSVAVESIRVGCEHDPKYGHPTTPIPDGFVWAAVTSLRTRPRTRHLVLDHERDSRYPHRLYPWDHGKVAALCKRSESRSWSDDRWDVDELPECLSCQAVAAKTVTR